MKTFADDTRLRIINLLKYQELNVTDLCEILNMNQPNISKHLSRLRLTGIVRDKREGLNVIYYLSEPEDKAHQELLHCVTEGLSDCETFVHDFQKTEVYLKNKNS